MIWSALLLLAIVGGDPAPAAACSTRDLAARGDAVAEARERLMALRLDELHTHVDREAKSDIESLKDRLVDFVVASVGCADAGDAPEAIADRLRSASRATPDPRDYNDPASWRWMHGAGLSYDVAVPAGHPELLAVVARFEINCGEDAAFMLFDRRGGAVRPLMIRRSAPYDEVNGAWEDLRYAVSPADREGRWYVAVAHIPSWCQSNWRSLFYDLARPGRDAASPEIFLRRRVPTFIGNEVNAILSAESDRFSVAHDGGIVDHSIILRRHVETYSLSGNAVRRVQPVAYNVRDFADEWIAAPWDEARAWSVPELEPVHRTIAADLASAILGEFRGVRRCASASHEVTLERYGGGNEAADGAWYLTVAGNGPYRMTRASRTPAGGCDGPDRSEAIEAESRRRMGTGEYAADPSPAVRR